MKAQLLEDLQTIQRKSDGFLDEAKNSEHGAGYFWISKRIDKILGYVSGVRSSPKLMSLKDLHNSLTELGRKYGENHLFSISVEMKKTGNIEYSCRLYGTLSAEKESYGKYQYLSNKNFDQLLEDVEKKLIDDKRERAELPEEEKDVAIK